jgi:hypothetical protein
MIWPEQNVKKLDFLNSTFILASFIFESLIWENYLLKVMPMHL